MFLSDINSRNIKKFWGGALLWGSSYDLSCHNSCLFLGSACTVGSTSQKADRSSGSLIRNHCAPQIKERDNLTLTFDCLSFLASARRFLLTALAFSFCVVLKYPFLIASDDSTKQVWFSLKILADALIHLHIKFLLILNQCFGNNFVLIFRMLQFSVVIFQTLSFFYIQLIYNHSNSQLTIAIHQLSYPLDFDLSPVCWRPTTSGLIIHLLKSLFETFVPLMKTYAQHSHLLTHQRLVTDFFPTGLKISSFSLLSFHHSFFNTHSCVTR